jgi:hypothetical protein
VTSDPRSHRRAAPLAVGALLASMGGGCGGGDGGPADGIDTELAPACVDFDVTCPADAPELGMAGEYSVATIAVEWEQCPDGSGPAFAPFIHAAIPADTVSFAVTVDADSETTGIAKLRLGDRDFIEPSAFGEEPFFHYPLDWAASTVVFPIDDETRLAGDSCVSLLPVADASLVGEAGRVHLVSRRRAEASFIDLNLVLVEGTDVTEAQLRETAQVVADVYAAGQTAHIGDVNVVTTNVVGAKINSEGSEIDQLRALDLGTSQQSINVFFVADFTDDPGTLGFAGGIPGPIALHGTAASGVMIAVDSHRDEDEALDTQTMGETLAHELGHQLGLFHTTEPDGSSFDNLADTPECPLDNDSDGDGELSAEECADLDGSYVMFWISGISQQRISPSQAAVLSASPVTR